MSIRKATSEDFKTVKEITEKTISEIYPHYYPNGAVNFFLAHHKESNIINDIHENNVYICFDDKQNAVGTVTVKHNEICRLFVLPKYQGYGYGRELMNYAEQIIFEKYSKVLLDASLPAKKIYLKRGYFAIESNVIPTENGDFLCYDVMVKNKGETLR